MSFWRGFWWLLTECYLIANILFLMRVWGTWAIVCKLLNKNRNMRHACSFTSDKKQRRNSCLRYSNPVSCCCVGTETCRWWRRLAPPLTFQRYFSKERMRNSTAPLPNRTGSPDLDFRWESSAIKGGCYLFILKRNTYARAFLSGRDWNLIKLLRDVARDAYYCPPAQLFTISISFCPCSNTFCQLPQLKFSTCTSVFEPK